MCKVVELKETNYKVKEIFEKGTNPIQQLSDYFKETFEKVDLITRNCFRAENFLVEYSEGFCDIIYGKPEEIQEEVDNLRFGEVLLQCFL